MRTWEDVNGIMQLYPRSYRDANGDGVGDLRGIKEKLSYIKGGAESLNIDAIWLSPVYKSPMYDFGYDVSDYRDIDPLFGDLRDMDELIEEAHKRGIKVMMDFVPNHSSSTHPWFQQALSSVDSEFRDYYIFRDPAPDGGVPNNWLSVFGGSAWQLDEDSGQYYLHSFLKEQPDLNWQNPNVQEEMANVLRFWFERGVDGIRADAIRWMGKNTEFLDDPINDAFLEGQDPYHAVSHHYSRFSPQLNDYLRVMTNVAREYDDKILIFEDHLDSLSPLEQQIRRINSIDPGVAGAFNFQGMHIGFGSLSFSNMINQYQQFLPPDARAYYCFSNHDESRLATRFGNKEARMLAALQLTLPGTPVVYYGQEIGMRDVEIPPEAIKDPFELRVPGRGLGRDGERTPMQWNGTHLGGFSDTAESSWLPLAEDYKEMNVEAQLIDKASSLSLYKHLLELRKTHETLRNGEYEHVYTDDQVMVFRRHDADSRFLTIANFSEEPASVDAAVSEGQGVIVASAQDVSRNGETVDGFVSVGPLDCLVIKY